ncbi:MAG: AraC family transcriptional regulator ligand-binding domain-containing protein, partial [Nannocystaceae bacterium]|nr:AraC family transcriptional regulator ligand-binding domain-containing protein [Nannocystaceae bacterium]
MDASFRTDDDKLRRAGTRSGFVAAVVLFGIAKGVPTEEMEAAIGMTLKDLVDPDARLPDAVLGAAWRKLNERFADSAIALELADAAPPTAFGPLAQALHYASTHREALETVVRYHKVLSGGLQMELQVDDLEVAMVFAHSLDAVDAGLGSEAAVALATRMSRDLLGLDQSLVRIEFQHPARGRTAEAFAAWFGVPVRFEATRNAVVFGADGLGEPPIPPNPDMYRYIEAHLDLVCERLRQHIADAPLDRVRAAIAARARESKFGADDVAGEVGMSVRTLQRYTAKHGASLRELIDEAREASASRLLADRRL